MSNFPSQDGSNRFDLGVNSGLARTVDVPVSVLSLRHSLCDGSLINGRWSDFWLLLRSKAAPAPHPITSSSTLYSSELWNQKAIPVTTNMVHPTLALRSLHRTIAAAARPAAGTVLTCPSKVAQALDWHRPVNGTVLALNISKDRIDLAVASHPNSAQPVLESLPSIPLTKVTCTSTNRKLLTENVKQELQQVLHEFAVCGLLVAWPVQLDSGRCGAPCGHVYHTLDQLLHSSALQTTTTAYNNLKKQVVVPVCLYDTSRTVPDEDGWGRSEAYGRTPPAHVTHHRASVEQYTHPHQSLLPLPSPHTDDTTVQNNQNHCLLDMWTDFCLQHWPELDRSAKRIVAQSEQFVRRKASPPLSQPPPPPAAVVKASAANNTRKRRTTTPLSGRKKSVDLFDPSWLQDDGRETVYSSSSSRALTF
jgi:hypothetical protein